MAAISKRIKKLRSLLKLTQQEFVHPLSITQAALSSIEKGGGVSHKTISEIYKHYKPDHSWLEFGKGVAYPKPQEEILDSDLSFHFNTSIGSIKRIGEYMMKDSPSEKIMRVWGKTVYDEANKIIKLKQQLTKGK